MIAGGVAVFVHIVVVVVIFFFALYKFIMLHGGRGLIKAWKYAYKRLVCANHFHGDNIMNGGDLIFFFTAMIINSLSDVNYIKKIEIVISC